MDSEFVPGELLWEEDKSFRAWTYRPLFEITVEVDLHIVVRKNRERFCIPFTLLSPKTTSCITIILI